MIEPGADHLVEAIAPEMVLARAPFATHLDEAGFLEQLEVPGGRRPRVLEPGREVARRELAAALGQEDEDVAARLVGEREKDRVDVAQRRLLHGASISAQPNN